MICIACYRRIIADKNAKPCHHCRREAMLTPSRRSANAVNKLVRIRNRSMEGLPDENWKTNHLRKNK